jgi:hypothetical protein
MKPTFGTKLLCQIFHQWLTPRLDGIHDVHVILAFCCEASDGLADDDGLPRSRVNDTRIDGRSMTAAGADGMSGTLFWKSGKTYTDETIPPLAHTSLAIFWRCLACG